MKDFKDSTKVQYMKGGSCEGYAKGGSVKGAAKISKVMGEFKSGKLHSGSKQGPEVTSKKQATAIALSEARKAGAKIPQPVQKKSLGGVLKAVSPAAALLGSDVGKDLMGAGVFGVGGLLLNQLLKKKQNNQPMTMQEQQQLAAAQKAQGQTAMKKGGPVKKNTGGVMKKPTEAVSTRPVDKSGRRITLQELEQANRDTGAMSSAQVKAARDAAARASRMQALEAGESRLVKRPRDPRTPLIQRNEGGLSVMPRGKK